MSRQDTADHGHRKLFIQVLVVVVLGLTMGSFITHLYRVEPDYQAIMLEQLGDQMQSSATHAHWQWQAEGRPDMIMLVHYDEQGKEKDRRPVRMALNGWPKLEPTSEGCNRLWRMLLNVPMQIDGFRVLGEYYEGELVNKEAVNARCRFRLSVGAHFDYAVVRGEVTHNKDD